jgi:phage gp45-like
MKKHLFFILILLLSFQSYGAGKKWKIPNADTLVVKHTNYLADTLTAGSTAISATNGKLDVTDSSITITKLNQILLENQTAYIDSDSVHVDISSYSFTAPKVILTSKSAWHAAIKSVSASEIVLYIDISGSAEQVIYDLLILEQ